MTYKYSLTNIIVGKAGEHKTESGGLVVDGKREVCEEEEKNAYYIYMNPPRKEKKKIRAIQRICYFPLLVNENSLQCGAHTEA